MDDSVKYINRKLRLYVPVFILVLALVLIALRITFPAFLEITWPLVGLLVLVVLLPFVSTFEEISLGPLEMRRRKPGDTRASRIDSSDFDQEPFGTEELDSRTKRVARRVRRYSTKSDLLAIDYLQVEIDDALFELAETEDIDHGQSDVEQILVKLHDEHPDVYTERLLNEVRTIRSLSHHPYDDIDENREIVEEAVEVGIPLLNLLRSNLQQDFPGYDNEWENVDSGYF